MLTKLYKGSLEIGLNCLNNLLLTDNFCIIFRSSTVVAIEWIMSKSVATTAGCCNIDQIVALHRHSFLVPLQGSPNSPLLHPIEP